MDGAVGQRDYQEQDSLREYIQVLLRGWWLIALLTLLAAIAAGVSSFVMTPTYQTKAGVLIAKSGIEVSFEDQMRTLDENELALLSGNFWRDQESRRSTLAGLVNSGTIATQVIDELGDTLSRKERTPSRLLGMVKAEIGQQGDLIEIVVRGDSPTKVAAIANAWAKYFEQYVNQVYSGGLPASYASVQSEVLDKKSGYEDAQEALTEFMVEKDRTGELKRLIEDKELIISELQSSKQEAIAAIVEDEIEVRRQVVAAYLQAITDARLLGFTKEQEAKRQVLSELIDAEIANRLAALRRDRDLRLGLFNSYVEAELQSRLAVFQQQALEQVGDLEQAYARKDKLDQLLRDVRSLRAQVAEAGSFESNQLALALVKAEAFASSVELSSTLQVQLPLVEGQDQLADVDALIAALEQERSEVEADIRAMSEELLAGTGYEHLDGLLTGSLASSVSITNPLTLVSSEAGLPTDPVSPTLSAAIDQAYEELFDVGGTARAAEQFVGDTPLFQELYPELFQSDELVQLTESISADTALGEQAQQRAQELLQLDGMEVILNSQTESEPMTQKIAELQSEVREMRAISETISSELRELQRARDLAWETYTTLARKEAELDISSKTGGSEVQFAKPAIVPDSPVSPKTRQNILLAGIVGGTFGIFLVIALHYLNPEYEFRNPLRGLLGTGRRTSSGE
jgi:capsular polysaccharide biosynthesis protein